MGRTQVSEFWRGVVVGAVVAPFPVALVILYLYDQKLRRVMDSAYRLRRELAMEQARRDAKARARQEEPLFVKPDGVKFMPDGLWAIPTQKERRYYNQQEIS